MSRIRYLKPDFFKDEDLKDLPFWERIFFEGLWCQADKEGRLEDRPERLKVEIMPYDKVDPERALQDLASPKRVSRRPYILRYEVNGVRYIQILSWYRHQKPHHTEAASVIPAPPDELVKKTNNGYVTVNAPLDSSKETVQLPRNGEGEGKGNGEIYKAENPGPFDALWKSWPIIGRSKKPYCLRKVNALVKAGKLADFQKVTRGYFIFLDWQKSENNFEQRPMNLATWLNNWEGEKERYLDKNGNVLKPQPRL